MEEDVLHNPKLIVEFLITKGEDAETENRRRVRCVQVKESNLIKKG